MTTAVMPAWMAAGHAYVGLKEIPGAKSDPTIMGWAKREAGWLFTFFSNDDVPWCALFQNASLWDVGLRGTGSLAAKSFAESWKYGIRLNEPVLGAILVFTRDGGGHVGMYAGETKTHYKVLGGNQKNMVSYTLIAKERLTAIMWPMAVPVPATGRIMLLADGSPVSTDEA